MYFHMLRSQFAVIPVEMAQKNPIAKQPHATTAHSPNINPTFMKKLQSLMVDHPEYLTNGIPNHIVQQIMQEMNVSIEAFDSGGRVCTQKLAHNAVPTLAHRLSRRSLRRSQRSRPETTSSSSSPTPPARTSSTSNSSTRTSTRTTTTKFSRNRCRRRRSKRRSTTTRRWASPRRTPTTGRPS